MLNALTVDVEDYFQVSAFEKYIDRSEWPNFPSRVVRNTQRVLELFDQYSVKATFFVLGWVADRFPNLVDEISAAGHEVGSHGYWHRLIYNQTPDEFRADIRQSCQVLTNITGRPVTTYRAPSFSIIRKSLWALEVLAEEGIKIDSSIFPIVHDRYGIRHANPDIHELATPAGSIIEFPPSVYRVLNRNIPVSGGGYFRLFPVAVTQHAIRKMNRKGHPFILYFHPWEIDPKQPRLPFGSPVTRFRHYLNLASAMAKLKSVLAELNFRDLSSVVNNYSVPPSNKAGVPKH